LRAMLRVIVFYNEDDCRRDRYLYQTAFYLGGEAYSVNIVRLQKLRKWELHLHLVKINSP